MAEQFKNNVTRLLDSKKISYQLCTYDYDAGIHSAVEVAEAIGLPAEQVFKTLVVLAEEPRRKPMLVIVPGPATLDLRAFAKAVKLKKAKMATHEQAESMTGLQTGGISALALVNKAGRRSGAPGQCPAGRLGNLETRRHRQFKQEAFQQDRNSNRIFSQLNEVEASHRPQPAASYYKQGWQIQVRSSTVHKKRNCSCLISI